MNIFKCGNCGARWDKALCPEAQDLDERLDYNGPYTDRECPICGALAYLMESKPKARFNSGDKVKDAVDRLTATTAARDIANEEHKVAVREFLQIMKTLSRTEMTLACTTPKPRKKKPKCKT
jgi:hypothetical protein